MLAVILAAAVVVVPLSVFRAHRDVDDGFVADWAAAHALTLTPENRPMVAWYLGAARVLRTWGAIGGLLVPSFFALVWSDHLEILGFDSGGGANPGDAAWIFVGYLIGVLYAELSLVRPVDGPRRAASLVPRVLEDYLPRRVLHAQRGLAAVAIAGAVVSLALPYDQRWGGPSAVAIVVLVAFALSVGAGLESLERWLVRRPQPFTDPSLVAADDAIRSQSVNSVAGAGLSFLLFLAGGVFALLASADVPILRWTMWVPALAAVLLALVTCQYFGHQPWRVRRTPAAAPA